MLGSFKKQKKKNLTSNGKNLSNSLVSYSSDSLFWLIVFVSIFSARHVSHREIVSETLNKPEIFLRILSYWHDICFTCQIIHVRSFIILFAWYALATDVSAATNGFEATKKNKFIRTKVCNRDYIDCIWKLKLFTLVKNR